MKAISVPFLCAVSGAAFFFFAFGLKILDPTFIDWVLNGDFAATFLGWHFFRFEPWQLPLGAFTSYYFPQGGAVVFTDSIPLVAILLKLVSPFLPQHFQYHGIWLLSCYVLQGFFAALLIRRVTTNPFFIFFGSVLFLLSPTMYHRAQEHMGLSAHWLLLAGLYLYLGPNSRSNLVKWSILLVIAAAVSAYLLIMVGMLWAAYGGKNLVDDFKTNYKPLAINAAVTFLSVLLVLWQTGYFVIQAGSAASSGFGYFSMNLLSPFNPAPIDQYAFLKTTELATAGQYEGFNYLGFGVLLLLVVAAYEVARHKPDFSGVKRHVPLMLVCILLTLMSISDWVTFGDRVLFHVSLPGFLQELGAVFRSSGRFFWPVGYTMIFAALAVLARRERLKTTAGILLLAGAIQFLDMRNTFDHYCFFGNHAGQCAGQYAYMPSGSRNLEARDWSNPLKSDDWKSLARHYKHIELLPPNQAPQGPWEYIPFGLLAADHHATMNLAYVNRSDVAARTEYIRSVMEDFHAGRLTQDSLYVIHQRFDGSFLKANLVGKGNTTGVLDGFALVAPGFQGELPDLQPWPFSIVQDDELLTLEDLIRQHQQDIVILAAKDDATNMLPADFVEEMRRKSSSIDSLAYRGSYAAVLQNGALVREQVSNDNSVRIELELPGYRLVVGSGGLFHGDFTEIKINNWQVSPNRRGINVVIIHPASNMVSRYAFDTHAGDAPRQNTVR